MWWVIGGMLVWMVLLSVVAIRMSQSVRRIGWGLKTIADLVYPRPREGTDAG